MMSLWHLLWIVPITMFVGYTIINFISINCRHEEKTEIYQEGYNHGYSNAINNFIKLEKLENSEVENISTNYDRVIKFAVEQELNVPNNLDDAELDKYLM